MVATYRASGESSKYEVSDGISRLDVGSTEVSVNLEDLLKRCRKDAKVKVSK